MSREELISTFQHCSAQLEVFTKLGWFNKDWRSVSVRAINPELSRQCFISRKFCPGLSIWLSLTNTEDEKQIQITTRGATQNSEYGMMDSLTIWAMSSYECEQQCDISSIILGPWRRRRTSTPTPSTRRWRRWGARTWVTSVIHCGRLPPSTRILRN